MVKTKTSSFPSKVSSALQNVMKMALSKQKIRDETKMKRVMFVVIGPHQSSDICTGPGGVTQYGFIDSE